MLAGEHAELFVAVTQLKSGERIHFLSEARNPSLVTWQHHARRSSCSARWRVLALWSNGVRFGQLSPCPDAEPFADEQIRGTGGSHAAAWGQRRCTLPPCAPSRPRPGVHSGSPAWMQQARPRHGASGFHQRW